MEVIKIIPQGFCVGVTRAIEMTKKALLDENTPKPIYVMGDVVHNDFVTNELIELGAIIERGDKIEFIDSIDMGTIIFTAHGIDYKILDYTKNKGLNIIDTTCVYVTEIQDLVRNSINDGKCVIYIAKDGHPEAMSVMAVSDETHLIESVKDVDLLPDFGDKEIVITNQTTLNINMVDEIIIKIKDKYKNVEDVNEICDATRSRQEAIAKYADKVDIVVVVGSIKSHNTSSLVSIAESLNLECYFVEKESDIDDSWFDDKHEKIIGVTSGASTPSFVTNKVIEHLKNIV